MELYVMRHGITVWNEKKRTQGQVNNRLSKNGIEKVIKTASETSDLKFDYIYTSPLLRAVQTANLINKFHKVKVIKDQRLTDIDQGDFTGRYFDSLTEEEKEAKRNKDKKYNMETNEEYYIRIKNFYNYLKNKHKNDTVLVVTHSGAIRLLEYILKHKTFDEKTLEKMECIDNSIIKQLI